MIKVGFTGTQRGMTARQKNKLAETLMAITRQRGHEFHHGDCVGADAEAHHIAQSLGWRTVVHPPDIPEKRYYCNADVLLLEKPYLIRNKDIVNMTDEMIAAPRQNNEVLRSGTWSTIRFANKQMKTVSILYPEEKGLI